MSPTARVGRSVISPAPEGDLRRWLASGPACSASSRSASALRTPRAGHDDRGLHAALRRIDGIPRRDPVQAGRLHHDPLAPIDQLVVPGPEIHHQVAVGLPESDHGAGGDRIEHQLGGGSRLHSGRAGHDLGPDQDGDADIAAVPQPCRAARSRTERRCAPRGLGPDPEQPLRTAWFRWRQCRSPRLCGPRRARSARARRRRRRPRRPRPSAPAPGDRRRSVPPPSPAASRTSAGTRRHRARRAGRWCRPRRRSAGRRPERPPPPDRWRERSLPGPSTTAAGTPASSAPMRSTISRAEAVSMVELRGLRRSVRRVS